MSNHVYKIVARCNYLIVPTASYILDTHTGYSVAYLYIYKHMYLPCCVQRYDMGERRTRERAIKLQGEEIRKREKNNRFIILLVKNHNKRIIVMEYNSENCAKVVKIQKKDVTCNIFVR